MKAFLTAMILLSCACPFVSAQDVKRRAQDTKTSDTKHQSRPKYVADEILVKFDGGTSTGIADAANRSVGASKVEDLGDTGWQRAKIPAAMTVDQAIAQYQSIGGVAAAQPNFYYHLLNTPNDTSFGSMYGLAKISAPAAWDLTTGSSAVVVADIDTGMRYTHEDLAANAWHNPGEIPNNGIDDDGNGFIDDYYGWDFRFNDSDPTDLEPSGVSGYHGTHTAGTIGAVGNNGLGVVGVNWNVKLMTIKIFNNNVSDDTTSAMLVNAYNYIRMMKNRGINIRVTNNSYGDCTEACGYDQATKDALDALGDAGVLNVFSAGNDNNNNDAALFYPASYNNPTIISVAASDSTDSRASFSNYGATTVDLAAPGVGILSTMPTGYGSLSGTSMAGPHVTGAAALLAAYNPNLSVASLKATLMNTVDVLGNWNGVVKSGGRLNVDRALRNQTVCTFNAGATQFNTLARGGIITLNVSAPNNCDYYVKSDLKWVTVLDSAPQSGNGTVRLHVSLSRTAVRTGTVRIGDQTITIRQARNGL